MRMRTTAHPARMLLPADQPSLAPPGPAVCHDSLNELLHQASSHSAPDFSPRLFTSGIV